MNWNYHSVDALVNTVMILLLRSSNGRELVYLPCFIVLTFQNGLENCSANGFIYSGDDSSTSGKSLANF